MLDLVDTDKHKSSVLMVSVTARHILRLCATGSACQVHGLVSCCGGVETMGMLQQDCVRILQQVGALTAHDTDHSQCCLLFRRTSTGLVDWQCLSYLGQHRRHTSGLIIDWE